MANQEFKSNLFSNNHYYGKRTEESSINAFSSQDLSSFYYDFYTPENCYIIISGKINANVIDNINSFIGSDNWKKDNHTNDNQTQKKLSIKSEKGGFYINKENSMQAALKYGRVLFNRKHDDFFGMQILSTILGGYFGSRLMKNIREDKGYTYGIGCSMVSLEDSGYFVISSEVKNDVKELTIKEIEKEIVTLQEELVNNDELKLVKNYLLGSFLRLFDGVFSKADRVNILINNDLQENYYNEYINKINHIQAEEIQLLAKKYLDKNEITKIIVG
ncbi:MAG: insulinase family protein [Bacteroidetes bacterium]|nr:insulinase family protein [Bacteroidota bacterium]